MSLESWIRKVHAKNKVFAVDPKNVRRFGVLFIILTLGSSYFELAHKTILCIICSYFIFSLFFPKIATPILYIWMWFGVIMGEITGSIFLGLIYYLILFPISFFVKNSRIKSGWRVMNGFSDKEKMY